MLVIPMTCPWSLTRAPPELPVLSAAVVWRRVIGLPSTSMSRLMAERMPSVMVPRSSSPMGLPMATTASPTTMSSESPKAAGVSPSASIFSTARSVVLSLPTSFAWNPRPSSRETSTRKAPSMTWALVMR